jgi:hypothetical protein
MVHIIQDERGAHIIAPISEAALRGYIARSADHVKVTKDGNVLNCSPPLDVVRDILALPPLQWGFPALSGITETPVIRRDGSILATPGFDKKTGLVYVPPKGFSLPAVPLCPDRADIQHAIDAVDDVIGEFPFVDDSSKENAIGAMVTPICRPAIDGPTPLEIIDATDAGSGKTLLTEIISIAATGRPGSLFSAPAEEEEWRKALTSIVLQGCPVVVIDNVTRRLDSAALCKVLTLTETVHGDRLLGTNQTASAPVLSCWLATGNNIQLGGDMPRRCVWVRMDPKCARPFQRKGFRHENLKAWTVRNRSQLICALLTLARAWFSAGKPLPKLTPLGSFEEWSVIVGGILQHAGFKYFLANSDKLYSQSDSESEEWEAFLLAVHEECPDEFYVADITTKITQKPQAGFGGIVDHPRSEALHNTLPDFLAEFQDRPGPLRRRLGKCFASRVGRRHGESGVFLQTSGRAKDGIKWSIQLPNYS